jgi:hypothetical protein
LGGITSSVPARRSTWVETIRSGCVSTAGLRRGGGGEGQRAAHSAATPAVNAGRIVTAKHYEGPNSGPSPITGEISGISGGAADGRIGWVA